MLNTLPLWKYTLLVSMIFIGTIFALPNLYPEHPSIQINNTYNAYINEKVLDNVENILHNKKVPVKSITLKKGFILARFHSIHTQLHAYEILKSELKDQYIMVLSFSSAAPCWLTLLGIKPIKLGLDLRGGVHFLIEIDINKIFKKLQEQNITDICSYLHKEKIPYFSIHKIKNYRVSVLFKDQISRNLLINYLMKCRHDLTVLSHSNQIQISTTAASLQERREHAIKKNISILRDRINKIGVSEALVQRQGINHIIIELPGIQDVFRAKKILGSIAMLEFRLVNTDINQSTIQFNHIPNDSEIKKNHLGQSVLLYKHVILNGDHVINAFYSQDEYNQPQINITLDSIGSDIMYNFTRKNIGKLMAILLTEYKDIGKTDKNNRAILVKQEKIISIAHIQSSLSKNFRIIGINSLKEARRLSLLMQSGTLNSPIKIIEEKIVGPTLGEKNIQKGLNACLIAILAASIFMICFYKTFGLIAIIAMIINLELIIAFMSLLPGAVLTLPGIAGIVLTIAVAIDANVLINERIKEELNNGRSIQMAIYEGYKRVSICIFDSNITTLIKVVTLYVIGNGPIKGFSIITAVGIITSMFTSILGTRVLVNLFYGSKKCIKKLPI